MTARLPYAYKYHFLRQQPEDIYAISRLPLQSFCFSPFMSSAAPSLLLLVLIFKKIWKSTLIIIVLFRTLGLLQNLVSKLTLHKHTQKNSLKKHLIFTTIAFWYIFSEKAFVWLATLKYLPLRFLSWQHWRQGEKNCLIKFESKSAIITKIHYITLYIAFLLLTLSSNVSWKLRMK